MQQLLQLLMSSFPEVNELLLRHFYRIKTNISSIFRFMCIWIKEIFPSLRSWWYHLMRYHSHNGKKSFKALKLLINLKIPLIRLSHWIWLNAVSKSIQQSTNPFSTVSGCPLLKKVSRAWPRVGLQHSSVIHARVSASSDSMKSSRSCTQI